LQALDARPLGLGLGLYRLRALDRLFPVSFAGLRFKRVAAPPAEACSVLSAGERLRFGAADSPDTHA
jgi:hypothetical protein